MSFSYDYNLTTPLDQLRFLTSDTSADSPVYQDEEINGLFNLEPNLYMAAARAIQARIHGFVTKAFKYQIGAAGDRSAIQVDRTGLIKNFMLLVDKYEAVALSGLDEAFDRMAFDVDMYGRDRSEYQGVNYGTDEWGSPYNGGSSGSGGYGGSGNPQW